MAGCCSAGDDKYDDMSPSIYTAISPKGKGGAKDVSQYKAIKNRHVKTKTLYEDPEFAADASNLVEGGNDGIMWLRPPAIIDDAKFVVDGIQISDVDQGDISPSWFTAAVVSLIDSKQKPLLDIVVPQNQGFDKDNYCGAFHFHFHNGTSWVEVVVDDRLPARLRHDGKIGLIYSRNRNEENEFWLPLLEKAFAKLNGGYHKMEWGKLDLGIKRLTGGTTEIFDFRKPFDMGKLTEKLLFFNKMNSLMVVVKLTKKEDKREGLQGGGLYAGHAYSVVDVREMDTTSGLETIVNVRNTRGKGEWTGDWSDRSEKWQCLLNWDEVFQHEIQNDGDFWINVADFTENFSQLFVCHLKSNYMTKAVASALEHSEWRTKELVGERDSRYLTENRIRYDEGKPLKAWKKPKPGEPMWSNPQVELNLLKILTTPAEVKVELTETYSSAVQDDTVTDIVLLKRVRDKGVTSKKPEKAEDESSLDELGRKQVTRTAHFQMSTGDAIIIPCFMQPDTEAEFRLKVKCDQDFSMVVLDEPVSIPRLERSLSAGSYIKT